MLKNICLLLVSSGSIFALSFLMWQGLQNHELPKSEMKQSKKTNAESVNTELLEVQKNDTAVAPQQNVSKTVISVDRDTQQPLQESRNQQPVENPYEIWAWEEVRKANEKRFELPTTQTESVKKVVEQPVKTVHQEPIDEAGAQEMINPYTVRGCRN